jgi:hypothetical protein
MSEQKFEEVNARLKDLPISFVRIGRGYGFRIADGNVVRLSHFTGKKLSDLTVDEVIGFASNIEISETVLESALPKTYKIETKEVGAGWNDSGFRHRVVCSDGRVSRWAPFAIISYLDDFASVTPYFTDKNDNVSMPVLEAMALLAYGEEKHEQLPSLKDEDDGLTEAAN